MRAAVLRSPGATPEPSDRDEPAPDEGQVLVDVTHGTINPLDVLVAGGTSYFGVPRTPYVPGVQGVGLVAGPGPARRVFFSTSAGIRPVDGSLAERCAADATTLVDIPDGVDDALAAALGLSAVAAHRCLLDRARLRDGEDVLVLGGGGTVGQVAVRLASLHGARTVVALARTRRAQERAREAGADATVAPHDGEDADALAARLLAATPSGRGFDVVVDPLGGVPATAAGLALADGGRLVTLGSSAGPRFEVDSASLRSRSAEVLGYTNVGLSPEQVRTSLGAVLAHAAAGHLRVDHEVVGLDDVGQAWARQADGRAGSRQVVRLR